MIRLRGIQNKTRQLFKDMSDIDYRLQYHPDLSPMGWHLGHGIFIENYWLHEVIQGNDQFTADKSLFLPHNCSKASRGPRLPGLQDLINQIQQQQDNNDLLLVEKTPPLSDHPLFKDEYIENLIIQHYAQHYEAIYCVLNQIALKQDKGVYEPQLILKPQTLVRDMVHVSAGEYFVGGELPLCRDNELPAHQIYLDEFYIASTPVTNGEYLHFMQDAGYQNQILWSTAGWQWREKNNIQHPEQWKQNSDMQWYGINHLGAFDLVCSDSVCGLSHYEACAFANWAGALLPHEHEWETAARLESIKETTNVWEWCNNLYSAYSNYNANPYNKDLSPGFDNNHYVLKGASQLSRAEIKRTSLRNFSLPHQRHIFAGLRLVYK